MVNLTLDDTVARTHAVLAADTGTEILALDEKSGNCFSFAGSGRLIWDCTKDPIRVRDICSLLRQQYQVDEATCAAETLAFINTLVAEKLLLVAPPKQKAE
jgi:hypothetical protein